MTHLYDLIANTYIYLHLKTLFRVYTNHIYSAIGPGPLPDRSQNPSSCCNGGREKKRKQPAPPTATAPAPAVASVFGNADLFHEIVLRLGFPADLVRAALVSKRWLRFVSDAVFLRRYRALRPPRLLGFFALPSARQSLRFVPMRQQPPALDVDDFKLGDDDDALSVSDCRNGRLIVATERRGARRLAVLSPLHHHHPAPRGGATTFTAALLQQLQAAPSSDAYGRSGRCFRHVLLPERGSDGASCTAVTLRLDHLDYSRARVEVSDLRAGAWGEERASNTVELPQKWARRRQQLLLAAGKISILCMAKHILCLSLRSMDLSCIELPDGVHYWYDTNVMMSRADDEGSGFYLVHVREFELHLWMYCSTGSGRWKHVDTICLRQAVGPLVADSFWKQSGPHCFYVYAVGDNAEFVFLGIRREVFCIHIASRAVEKVCDIGHRQLTIHPLMTIWPVFPSREDGHYQDD